MASETIVELAGGLEFLEILVRAIRRRYRRRRAPAGGTAVCRPAAPLRQITPLDLRHRAADPLVIALHDDFGAGGPLGQPCRRRSPPVLLLGVFEAPKDLFSEAFFFTNSELTTQGPRSPARSGIVSRSFLAKYPHPHRAVVDDDETARAWSASPRSSGRLGIHRTLTARSSDHFTSFCRYTGAPS